jgi:hypothetical protein
MLFWVFNDYIGYSGHWDNSGVYDNDRSQERVIGPVMQALYANLTAANP